MVPSVRNYTGDILHFGLSKEQYAALHPEKADRLKFVVVGDDVAVGKTQGSIVGRRYEVHTIITLASLTRDQRSSWDSSRIQDRRRSRQSWREP